MSRYELTINPTYIPDWAIWEALRELAQNSFDREYVGKNPSDWALGVEPDNPFVSGINYISNEQRMIFSNANTTIPTSSLLLGTTTKADDKNAIGNYGEGYKLAMLVLTRMGCRVTIYNGKEEWTPKIIKSRRYQSDLLVVDTCKAKKAHTDLSFVIDGINPTMYAEFALKCLSLNYPTNIIETDIGNILLDENQKGKIYCGGLYVQEVGDDECSYGYDIKPAHLELDRDRQKVSSWNLYWKTSEMYSHITNDENKDLVFKLIRDKSPDIQYYHHFTAHRTDQFYKDICESSYTEFITKHSVNAVPVKTKEEANMIRDKYNHLVPVILPEKEYIIVTGSSGHTDRMSKEKINIDVTPSAILLDFLNKYKDDMTEDAQTALERIQTMSLNWR